MRPGFLVAKAVPLWSDKCIEEIPQCLNKNRNINKLKKKKKRILGTWDNHSIPDTVIAGPNAVVILAASVHNPGQGMNPNDGYIKVNN